MMPGEFRSGHSKAQQDESDEARPVSKRPYVRPRIARQDLKHAVQGSQGSALDPTGSRDVPTKP